MQSFRDIFAAPWEQRFLKWYYRVFSVREIEENTILQLVFGATVFSHFFAFADWISSNATTVDAYVRGTHTCWPYFQSCGEYLFLRALPEGYSQTFLYMSLFGSLILVCYLMYRKEWLLAHILLIPSFLWHTAVSFFLTASLAGNYEYYLFFFSLVLLFFPYKEFFLKLTLVFLYFLSTSAKIHEAWVLGTYFSALKTGLPFFPEWSIPIWTNLLIGMEMVGAWFLLSARLSWQRIVFVFFFVFHLYSGLLVQYRYPATVLPTLFILFGPLYRYTPVPLTRKSIIGWGFIVLLFCAQMAPLLIRGDEKLTLEGNRFGLYMFESNHQCISTTRIHFADGTTLDNRMESNSARQRCESYRYWFRIKAACERSGESVERVSWTFDHSINGNPFLRIVDVEDACSLTFAPFRHNEWIKTHEDNPAVIGYPVESIYD
jgi:hypothetical protein